MGENIKLKRVGKDQTRVMSLRGYNLLSERDRKKWVVVDGEVEETKKKTVHVVGAGVSASSAASSIIQNKLDNGNIPSELDLATLETSKIVDEKLEENDTELLVLKIEYKELTGKEPKGNWKAKRLSEEIQKVKDGSHEAE